MGNDTNGLNYEILQLKEMKHDNKISIKANVIVNNKEFSLFLYDCKGLKFYLFTIDETTGKSLIELFIEKGIRKAIESL